MRAVCWESVDLRLLRLSNSSCSSAERRFRANGAVNTHYLPVTVQQRHHSSLCCSSLKTAATDASFLTLPCGLPSAYMDDGIQVMRPSFNEDHSLVTESPSSHGVNGHATTSRQPSHDYVIPRQPCRRPSSVVRDEVVWHAAMSSRSPALLLSVLSSSERPMSASKASAAAARLASLCTAKSSKQMSKSYNNISNRLEGKTITRGNIPNDQAHHNPSKQLGDERASGPHPLDYKRAGYASLTGSQQLQYLSFLKRLKASFPLPDHYASSKIKSKPNRSTSCCNGLEAVLLLNSLALMGKSHVALEDGILNAAGASRSLSDPGRCPHHQWIHRLKDWQAHKLCWSLATLRYNIQDQPQLMAALYSRTQALFLGGLGLSRASSLAWAMARLRGRTGPPPPAGWWVALEAATHQLSNNSSTAASMSDSSDDDFRNAVCSTDCNSEPPPGPPTLGRLVKEQIVDGERIVPQSPLHILSDPLVSMKSNGYILNKGDAAIRNHQRSGGKLTQIRSRISCPSVAGHAAALIWAAGQLNPDPRPSFTWVQSLLSVIKASDFGALSSRERSMTMHGLEKLGFRPPEGWASALLLGGVDTPRASNHKLQIKLHGSVTASSDETYAPSLKPPTHQLKLQQSHVPLITPKIHLSKPFELQRPLLPCGESTSSDYRLQTSDLKELKGISGVDLQASQLEAMLHSMARLKCSMTEQELEEAVWKLRTKLWQLSPKQLINVTRSLQHLGYSPSRALIMEWMEECHAHLILFTPRQLVQLTLALVSWRVNPPVPWVAHFLTEAERKLPQFSRTLLVELVSALALLGIKLDLGGLDFVSLNDRHGGTKGHQQEDPIEILCQALIETCYSEPSGSQQSCVLGTAPTQCILNGATFFKSLLHCFLSRKFKQPLPWHVQDLTLALGSLYELEGRACALEQLECFLEHPPLQMTFPPSRDGSGLRNSI